MPKISNSKKTDPPSTKCRRCEYPAAKLDADGNCSDCVKEINELKALKESKLKVPASKKGIGNGGAAGIVEKEAPKHSTLINDMGVQYDFLTLLDGEIRITFTGPHSTLRKVVTRTEALELFNRLKGRGFYKW